ncbi:MAG: protein translocase subunit SecD [Clostridia bacterium]|nr:protein translocase subunit SecD [Clostridia bacterium]MBQ7897784.1 protein translocase subunit SecD [Clostridia bacterium]
MAKNLTKLIAAIVLIALVSYVALCGIGSFLPGVFDEGAIRKGLDLAGGTLLVYEPDVDDLGSVSDADMDTVVSIMTNRLSNAGYTEATITQMKDDKRIQIEIPEVKDLDEARNLLGNIGELEFVNSKWQVVMTGSDIKSASMQYGQVSEQSLTPEYFVSVSLKPEAVEKFALATEEAAKLVAEEGNYIMIMLDQEIISVPRVSEKLVTEDVVITGDFTKESATYLASVIASGQLPFSLAELRADTVGPTLGEKALETALFAGAIGVLLVMLFMIVYYRLPGIVSAIALIAYVAIEAVVLVVAKVNLSLPGVAGIILSIGMAVDANVIIIERIKEELRVGKGTVSAVKSGFKGAFSSIIDSNITTLIAAAVLWYFGTGTVQGFAITLFIGIVVSMFTAIVVTRFLMNAIVGLGAKKPWLYGI